MTDALLQETQRLRVEIELLRTLGSPSAARPLIRREAELREELAKIKLAHGDADGFIDLLAAITGWTHFGARVHARHLVEFGRVEAAKLGEGVATVNGQLDEIEAWSKMQTVLPALSEYAVPLPDGALAA